MPKRDEDGYGEISGIIFEMKAHPRIDTLFRPNPGLLKELEAADEYGMVLFNAERLLADAEELDVVGVEKLGAVGGIDKFESIMAELRVGNMLARIGLTVQVLTDEAFGRGGIYTPDLLATGKDGFVILLDVVSGSHGDPDISGPLDKRLKEEHLPFRVSYYPGEELSIPNISGVERTQAKERVEKVVHDFISHLKTVNHFQSGEVAIGDNRFEYEPSPTNEGYAAGGVTAVHWHRENDHAAKFLRDIEKKADRQPKLPIDRRKIPFVAAYDNRESEMTPKNVLSALTGSRCDFSGSAEEREQWLRDNPIHHPPRVAQAWHSEWQPLLQEWDYGADAKLRITKYGAYLDSDWADRLSGVLVTHVRDLVQWLPNPFANEDLVDPRLLDLGLPIDKLGASHSAWQRYP